MQWAAGRAYLRGGSRNARDLVVLAISAAVRPLDRAGRDPSLKLRLHALGSRHIVFPLMLLFTAIISGAHKPPSHRTSVQALETIPSLTCHVEMMRG